MPINITKIEDALQELGDAVGGTSGVKEACVPLMNALADLHKELQKLHGLKDLIVHILDHLVEDGDKIFEELVEAHKSWKTGWDYMTAGQNLGMAFRRMLVGEMNNTIIPHPPIPGCQESIHKGMAIGFLSDMAVGYKELLYQLMDNTATDSENIFGHLANASKAHKNKDCMSAGRNMGIAFRGMLGGKTNSTKIVIV